QLEVPAVEVERGEARTPLGSVDLERKGETVCTVVRRDQFDARLASAAREAGLEIIDRCRVLDVAQQGEVVEVATDRGRFRAQVLLGADGSGSRVRTAVFGTSKQSLGRALMTDIPVESASAVEFREQRYRFDFRCIEHGIHGYAWSFPCLIDGHPHLNVGIYDQLPRDYHGPGGEQAAMLRALRAAFPELPFDTARHRPNTHAHPIRWFDARDRYVSGRVMLAGDAAGVDPLMGEGISCAFEHGKLAARAICGVLDGDSAALGRYDRALHRDAVGRKLGKLAFAASSFYGPRHRWFFRAAHLSRRAQEIGVDWFNGAHHLDQLPVAALAARWARAVLFGERLR
ncbi:MAG TPA: NAD(P)/FAD-dependent oxidoreductase, partial [Candidatus Binataceae bacterium]|nr:NAD(P)/FAD-dependent oxidoreductase [Candidatus Binataceae bacterium]